MVIRFQILVLALVLQCGSVAHANGETTLTATIATQTKLTRPNIVVLLADDMGYGEVNALNPNGKIKTPNLDRLSQTGMVFTDAHSGSSVCTPTRYGLLTGRYAWRTRLQRGVLTGGDSLIAKQTLTLAEMAKARGYRTVAIGKWHLGIKFDGVQNAKKNSVNVGSKVTHGPLDYGGFDEFYGFHHARQMDLWIENDIVQRKIQPVQMLPLLTRKAVEFVERQSDNEPFFMYVPWNSPHSPVVPAEDWKGRSGINAHADFVMQTDDSIGQIMQALKRKGLLENTLVVSTSDNGTSPTTSGLAKLKAVGHAPSGVYRGMKADIWDGGHRVPFIVSWPASIKPGSQSNQLICLTDIFATVAEVVDYPLTASDGVDSFSFLKCLTQTGSSSRRSVVHHSVQGEFAIRNSAWKLITCPGSGGWGKPGTKAAAQVARRDGLPFHQLYQMQDDPSESTNQIVKHGDIANGLRRELQTIIEQGRSTPGPVQPNDAGIVVEKWKQKKSPRPNNK